MTTRNLKVVVDGRTYDVQVEIVDEPAVGAPRPAAAPARPAASVAPPAPAPKPVASPKAAPTGGDGDVIAPLAGTVVGIHCQPGQQVQAGDTVVTLEAMKMNTEIAAAVSGTVKELAVNEGAVVGEGALLVTIA